MTTPETATHPTAQQRQLRLVIPPQLWDELIAYTERHRHDNTTAAAREIIRQALVAERLGAGEPT